jgi:hypothetical protein
MKPDQAAREAGEAADIALASAAIAKKAARDAEAAVSPPDPREGPHFDLLRGDNDGVFARMSPRRNRWPELEQIDGRIAEVDQQQAQIAAEQLAVMERRRDADARHQLALADWFAAGQPDPRPVSEAGELDDRAAALQAEHAARDILRDRLFEERAAYVVTKRKSLVRDADRATQKRLARCLALLDELEQAREDLIALRQSTVWAALYPSEALANEPPFSNALAGGRQSIQQKHLPGVSKSMLIAGNVLALLRDDVRHCAAALTVEQAAEISGGSSASIAGKDAAWQDRKFELEQERRQKQAAIEAYTKEWGIPPSEWA